MEPPDRLTSVQTLWENNKPAEPGPCGRKLTILITVCACVTVMNSSH